MSWNEYILSEFPETAFRPISILFDPQAIVADESIFAELEQRGYLVQEFSDTLSLRYTYENQVRNNSSAKWIIIVREEQLTTNDLPYDIIRQSRSVRVSFEALFPNLNYAVVSSLDRKFFSKLFDVREEIPCEIQNSKQSCEFLLERLFSISPDIVNTPENLLKLLFDVHFTLGIHSTVLLGYLAKEISVKHQFKNWDVEELFRSPEAFSAFMKERLLSYLGEVKKSDWQFNGPESIDFSSVEIKHIIGHIFASGYLHIETDINRLQKLDQYLSNSHDGSTFAASLDMVANEIESHIPIPDAHYQTWLNIARDWATLTALAISTGNMPGKYAALQQELNTAFLKWQETHYRLLASLPPHPPVMLHQIARYAARRLADGEIRRFALIVMDGLALNQWAAICPSLSDMFNITTDACFAWVPTLTSISRQAIFAGKIPAMFSSSIKTTAQEENLWQQAWEAYNISKTEVFYKKGLGFDDPHELLEKISPKIQICGFVIDVADRIMHGVQLGNSGVHNQLHQWMADGYLKKLLAGLVDMGFDIILTSDHGNVECTGIGRPQEGVLSEQHGERVRIYHDKNLASMTHSKIPQVFDVQPAGLPPEMYPVSLPHNLAFGLTGTQMIAHGGNSLEEVIVPMIHIASKRGQ